MNMRFNPALVNKPLIAVNYPLQLNKRNAQISAQSKAGLQRLTMYVTVDTQWVTTLRHLIINTFSDIVSFIRIQPIDHAKKMKVCLCFNGPVEERLMTAIMQTLPSAEFGRITAN